MKVDTFYQKFLADGQPIICLSVWHHCFQRHKTGSFDEKVEGKQVKNANIITSAL